MILIRQVSMATFFDLRVSKAVIISTIVCVTIVLNIGYSAAGNDILEGGPLDYQDTIKLALRQSPYFVKSSIEIDVRGLDESDSRFSMIPKI